MSDPNNPTLMDLLKMGCRIIFPGQYYLEGRPDTGYIDIGDQFGSDGLWSLDADGLESALKDMAGMEIRDEKAREQ